MGKKPAGTVVANAEFAQSYNTHPATAFRLEGSLMGLQSEQRSQRASAPRQNQSELVFALPKVFLVT